MNDTAPVDLSAALWTTESFGRRLLMSTPIPPPYEYVRAHSIRRLVDRLDVVFLDLRDKAIRQRLQAVEISGPCKHASARDEASVVEHAVESSGPLRAEFIGGFGGREKRGKPDEDIFGPVFDRFAGRGP